MRSIYVEDVFFKLNSAKSKYLISSLKEFNSCGYIIEINKTVLSKTKILKDILLSEEIKFKAVVQPKGAVIEGNKFQNLKEAAAVVKTPRSAVIHSITKETDIKINLDLDNPGKCRINTGIRFFDHMLEQIALHSNIGLVIDAKGDLDVDEHHTVEDTGKVLGEALKIALGDKKGIQRYGFFLPMDETASICAIDLSGRSYLNFNCGFNREYIGDFPTELTEEFFRALAMSLKANIYIKAKGKNEHHIIESIFKAFAKSLNEACRFDERNKNRLPSTKGVL